MAYVTDSNYSSVGDFITVPGMDVVGGLAGWPQQSQYKTLSGWPGYQPGKGWFRRQYETPSERKGGVLQGLADFFGSLAEDVRNAVTPPPPRVIGPNGQVMGVAKKPRGGKPGKLVPASGKMTMWTPQGKVVATVAAGAVVATAAAKPTARPTTLVAARPVPARRVPLPASAPVPGVPVVAQPVPLPATIASKPIAVTPIAPTPIATTAIATTVTAPPPAVSAAIPAPGTAAPAVPFAPNLPPEGVFGGRLPTMTQFAGRPMGTSATTAVEAVPIAPTMRPPTGVWDNVVRTPQGVRPTWKPRRLNPAFMANF